MLRAENIRTIAAAEEAAQTEFDRLSDDHAVASAAIARLPLINPMSRVSSSRCSRAELLAGAREYVENCPPALMRRLAAILAVPDFPSSCRIVGGIPCSPVPPQDRIFCGMVAGAAEVMTDRLFSAVAVIASPYAAALDWALDYYFPAGNSGTSSGAGEAASAAACAPEPVPTPVPATAPTRDDDGPSP